MISAWDVYWVMQLDSIGCAMVLFAALLTVGGIILLWASCEDADKGDEGAEAVFKWSGRAFLFGVFLGFASALVPSSKTAAAMIVLPAITSDAVVDTVAPEAAELYNMAKDALRDLAKEKKAEKTGD